MHFRIVDELTWSEKAVALVPTGTAGERERQEFELTFAYVEEEEIRAAEAKVIENGGSLEDVQRVSLRLVVRGWAGVDDAAGNPAPFSSELFEAALKMPWFRYAAIDAYNRGVSKDPVAGN